MYNNIQNESDLPNYTTRSDKKQQVLFAKIIDLISLKFGVDKLDIARLQTVCSNLNKLKSDVDKLDLHKLKTASIDRKEISDVADKYIVQNVLHDKLVSKFKRSESKIPGTRTLGQKLQYEIDKQNLNCNMKLISKICKKLKLEV